MHYLNDTIWMFIGHWQPSAIEIIQNALKYGECTYKNLNFVVLCVKTLHIAAYMYHMRYIR
jgi:hypothetical protein